MATGTLNYTSSSINSLLEKGAGISSPDTSTLVLKTTASSTYITQTDMSDTYQANGSYKLNSSLSTKCTVSTWSSWVSAWSSWYNTCITRAKDALYPVGSIYLNWSSSSSKPSWGTWESIDVGGLLRGYLSNVGDSLNDTISSDNVTLTHAQCGYDFTISGASSAEKHWHWSSSELRGWVGSDTKWAVTPDNGSNLSGSTHYYWYSEDSSNTVHNYTATNSTSASHSHSFSNSGKTASTTFSRAQVTDNIYGWVRIS